MALSLTDIQNLKKLQKWLEFEISSSLLWILSWIFPILLSLYVLAAIVFTPLMIRTLYQVKKYGWIIGFVILVLLPAIIISMVNFFISPLYVILVYFPIAAFILYCFTLKTAVKGWITDYQFINNPL